MKLKTPRIVIVDEDSTGHISEGCYNTCPWRPGDSVLLLGEIQNMPGHVVVATRDGKVHWGYPEENFREATEEEI